MTDDQAPIIDLGRFDEVDATRDPGDYVRWMEHQRRQGPDRSFESLEIDGSSTVLDLGCGPGADLEGLSAITPHVVGFDRSMTMARATRGRDMAIPPAVVVGDGHDLPFAEDSFDACWARAVLVHASEPLQLLHEIARVVRPGRRVVLSEPDQGSHVVATSEIEVFERIKRHRSETFRQPFVGRHLASLASQAGMTVERARPTAIIHRTLAAGRAAGGPLGAAVDAAVDAGVVSRREATGYEESLEELDSHDGFVFAALAFSVVATVDDRRR